MQNNKANAHLKIGHFKKHCLQYALSLRDKVLPFQKLVQTNISEANFPVVSYLPRNRMTWKDVTMIPSVLFSVARFSTQGNFHFFGMLTHGREKSILEIFWLPFSEDRVDSFKQINKILSYTL